VPSKSDNEFMGNIFKTPVIALSEAPAEGAAMPIQVLRTGDFFHDRYGNFKITKAMLSEMVSNFEQGIRGIKPALDYGHDSEGVAAGWFKRLWLSDTGEELWGEIDLTPVAVKKLADKEYGYVSAEFDPAYETNENPRKKVGAVLLGAGLTNRPVIKKMQPVIELSEGGKMKPEEMEKKLAEYDEKMKKLMESAGVETEEALMELIAKSKAPEMSEDMKKELMEKEEAMKKELSEKTEALKLAEQKLAESQKENQFTVMLSEGKVCAAQKEAFLKGDMIEFAKNAQAMNLSEKGHGGTQKTDVDAEEQILKLAKEMVTEKKIQLSEAISVVRKSNPELVKKLQEKK
jgi:phage I-like protein